MNNEFRLKNEAYAVFLATVSATAAGLYAHSVLVAVSLATALAAICITLKNLAEIISSSTDKKEGEQQS